MATRLAEAGAGRRARERRRFGGDVLRPQATLATVIGLAGSGRLG